MAKSIDYNERLLKVAEIIRQPIPDVRFDLDSWLKRTTDCGTAACAIGHAAMHPWFKNRGFHLTGGVPYFKQKNKYDKFGWDAVTAFFNISYTNAEYLFSSDFYRRGNREDVAKRVESFVRKLK